MALFKIPSLRPISPKLRLPITKFLTPTGLTARQLLYSEKLRFLKQYYSYRQLAQLTGIPQTTLYNTIIGIRRLPIKYGVTVTGFYYQDTYKIFRAAGANVYTARRWRGKYPQILQKAMGDFEGIVDYFTRGHWLKRIEYLERSGLYVNYDKEWARSESIIRRGLSESKKPIDPWDADY